MTTEEQYQEEAEKEFPDIDAETVKTLQCMTNGLELAHQMGKERGLQIAAYIKGRRAAAAEVERLKKELDVEWSSLGDAMNRLRKAEIELKEKEQFALEFADYLENQRWKHDHKEQKTHTITEHWEYFKQINQDHHQNTGDLSLSPPTKVE